MVINVSDQIKQIWQYLEEVKDPEIPSLNVVEMGIVRDVQMTDGQLTVTVTPTYSGCPAMTVIESEIKSTLASYGHQSIGIRVKYSPAWTTDWLTDEAKEKLKQVGIAPPCMRRDLSAEPFSGLDQTISCPFCDSKDTKVRSEFGSTACKAIYFCNACQQPFDYFKAI